MTTSESKFLVLGIFFILGGIVSLGYGIIVYSFSFPLILVFFGLFTIVIGIYFCQPEQPSKRGENRELKNQFWNCPNCHRKNEMTSKRCSKCGFFRSEEEQKDLTDYDQ